MLDVLKQKIKNLSADYGEIRYETVSSTRIEYSNNDVEAMNVSRTASGNVRVLDRDGWGFASFNQPDFDRYIEAAQRNARLIAGRKSNIVLFPQPVVADITTSYAIDPASLTLKDKNELVVKYNQLLRHPKIANTRVIYRDTTVEKHFVNSEGSAIRQTKTFTGIMVMALSRDGLNIQRAFDTVGTYGGFELVQDFEERSETVKRRAIDLLSAKKPEAGQYQVLLDPHLAGVFAHEAFGHLSEADFLYENPRFQDVMVLGREFGPEYLNIIDDGSLPELAGYTPFDEEGVPAHPTYLIKDGKLNDRLHSRETAAKMGESVTGNCRAASPYFQPIVRMTNTYIDQGNKSFDELIGSIDDGIYALDAIAGMTNLEMFTFTAGWAYRIRNGKIGELLRDVVLTGNVFQTLKNITAIGDDLAHLGGLGACGKGGQAVPVSSGSPHIAIKDVLVGGE